MLINTFSGVPLVYLLSDGRTVQLAEYFGFCDSRGREWWGYAGDIANGTSYPRPLWSLSGGPWSTRSRWAALIHDIFCERRSRTWQDTHRMYGEAALVAGVDKVRATFEFNMIWQVGPRWNLDGSAYVPKWADPWEYDEDMGGG